ncbi:MAG: anti-sigma factor antagonist [Bdellovibrionaceae bacterium]|nr:anti-sigma factor antagonist [Pseudobdellovibrionaceae bacterium]
MEAKFYQSGEITIVALKGRFEIEKTQAFKTACTQSLHGKKVVFCMKDLHFVGSTGIQTYFQIIREFSTANPYKAKVADLKPDFQRLWFHSNLLEVDLHENLAGALTSFQMPDHSIQEN